MERMWRRAGHIARKTDGRWTKKIMNWRLPKTRQIGRRLERWTNGIRRIAGTNWQQAGMDRPKRRELEQQWIGTGKKEERMTNVTVRLSTVSSDAGNTKIDDKHDLLQTKNYVTYFETYLTWIVDRLRYHTSYKNYQENVVRSFLLLVILWCNINSFHYDENDKCICKLETTHNMPIKSRQNHKNTRSHFDTVIFWQRK